MATVLPCVEGLSERRAADAGRGRIDWKYALGLALTDPGVDHTVWRECRTRLVRGQAEPVWLDPLVARVRELGLLKSRGRQRTDATHVLAAGRMLNRVERVGETRRATLHVLAGVAPAWGRRVAAPPWFERYGSRVENDGLPKTETARQELAPRIGVDGPRVLHAIDAATDQAWLRHIPAVVTRRRLWGEPYIEAGATWRWREVKEMPAAAEQLTSPEDPEARYRTKRALEGMGYKVHLTATCDADTPPRMVHVETTPATTPDDHMAAVVHQAWRGRMLLPREHRVDIGDTAAQMLVTSTREYGVTMVGPVAEDPGWQAREGTGFDTSQCGVDWERQVVTCPAGQQRISWHPHPYPARGLAFEARLARQDCTPCACRARSTRAQIEPRMVGWQVREPYDAWHTARQRPTTQAFHQPYAARSGIEATHEQAIRRGGLRRSRDIGLAKTHLHHLMTATAITLVRFSAWLAAVSPAVTRCSRFAALQGASRSVTHLWHSPPVSTSLSPGAISTAAPVWMKENSAFSFRIVHHRLVLRPQSSSLSAIGIPGDERYG